MCRGPCWTGLARCGFCSLLGQAGMASWMWLCGHGVRVQGEQEEAGQAEPETIAGFPRKHAFDCFTIEPMGRLPNWSRQASYLGSSHACTSRSLKSVHWNHLCDAHNSWGGRYFFTSFGQIRKVLSSGLTRVGSYHRSDGIAVRRWFPWRSWSLSAWSPCTFITAPFKDTFRISFPVYPFSCLALSPFLIRLYFLSSHTVAGTESIHFEQKSFWEKTGDQIYTPISVNTHVRNYTYLNFNRCGTHFLKCAYTHV